MCGLIVFGIIFTCVDSLVEDKGIELVGLGGSVKEYSPIFAAFTGPR